MIKQYLKDDLGAAAIEFALIATAFITLMFGLIEGGRFLMAQSAFQFAVEETARYVTIEDANGVVSDTIIRTRISEHMNNMLLSVDPATDLNNVTVTRPTGSNNVTFIQITGTYTYQPLIPNALPANWFNIAARTRLPLQ